MKKIYLLFLMLLLNVVRVNAQANFYSFRAESGNYTEVSNGTLFLTAGGVELQSNNGAPSHDSQISSLITIRPFNYGGVVYTQVMVSSNGLLGFGSNSLLTSTLYNAFASTTASQILSPFGVDLVTASSGISDIGWVEIGDETVIQWRNFRRYNFPEFTEAFSFQVRLNHTTNVIKFVYGGNPPFSTATLESRYPNIGIKTLNNENNFVVLGTGNSWSNATNSVATTATKCTITGSTGFTDGLTYVFTPPPPCTGVPNAGVVSLATQAICSGAIPAAISVTNVNTGASSLVYQWQVSNDNGISDPWIDVVDGTGGNTLTYIPPVFTGVTKFYRLKTTCTTSNQVANSNSSSVTNYSNPTTAATTMTFADVTDFSMKINWTNGNGMRRMVVINDVDNFVAPINGQAPAIVSSATYSGSGQQIIYDGTASTITVLGLSCSKTYYVRIYEYNRCGSTAPYEYWYGIPLEGSRITNATTLSTAVVNMNVVGNFTGFNTSGDNLSTILPGWTERKGDATFTANTSLWRGGVSLQSIPTARVELYTNTRKEWIITPLINLNVASRIKLKAAITAYNTVNAASGSNAPRMQGTDDKVQVMISTDACGNVWTSLFTFDASNTVNLTNILQDFEVPIPAEFVGQNIRIGFKATDGPIDDAPDYDFHIANVIIEPQPLCADTFGLVSTNILKNAATISWNASTPAPLNGYEIEIRTSGLPGTPGAIQNQTTAAGVITKNITNLLPSTTYQVYVRTICNAGTNGLWSTGISFTTLCNYPDFISAPPVTICGIDTVNLSANFSNNSNVTWFSSAAGGSVLYTGANFTTPEINATTSYFVQAGNPIPNSDIQVGNSTVASSSAPNSPYAYGWGGYKFQYIYTATELATMGLVAGPINSVGFNISSSATAPRPGFTIYIGTTSQNVATTTHVGGLTLVYSNTNQPLQLGINNYPFTSPFVWDGTSNIVVQVSWSNVDAASGTAASVFSHTTSVNQTTYSYGDRRLPSQILATMTGAPEPGPTATSNGSTDVSNARPNTYFNGMGICNSPRYEVVATVTPAPVLTLSDTSFTICEGQSKLVTVTAGATDYSTFEWIPAIGVSGTAATGFTFNPLVSTVYILKATQASGALCSEQVQINITVNELPTFTPLETSYEVCANEILELNPNASGLGDFIVGTATTLTDNFDSTTAFNNRFSGSRQQYIYTKDELNALGFFSGKIKGLAFEVASLGSAATNANYTIKMKAVTESSFANTTFLTGDFVTVFGPVTYTHTATGWHNFDFTAPFEWDGISNVLIELTHNGANTTNNSQTYYTETVDNKALAANSFAGATGTLSLKRLNTKFFDEGLSTTVWSPITNLYTDEAATIPYTGGNAKKVYFKSAQSITANYEAILTGFNQCATSLTTTVDALLVTNPVIAPQTFCEAKTISDIVVTGLMTDGLVKWYSSATSSDEITTITTSGTYYVTQNLRNCSSERVAVVISIKTITDAPAVEEIQNLCGTVTVADLQATPLVGNTISWFATMTSTTELASGDNVTTGSYYVAQFNGDCWSPRAKVTVNVNPVPVVPTAVNQDFCGIHTLSEVNLGQANNATLKWYRTNTSTSVLPLTTVIETGTYYVSQTISACESARVAVTMSVIDALPAPAAPADQAFCGSAIVSDLTYTAAQGAIVGWFTSQNEMTPLATTQNLTSRIYYVAQHNGACWSPKTEVQVQVNPIPAAPNNTALQLCGTYNFGQLSLGQAPNASLNWYSTVTSLTPIAPSTTVLTGTYFVSQTIRGCESVRVSINVIATETLLLPVATAQSFCGGATVSSLVAQGASGATFNWYPSANSITPLAPNTLLTTGTYYVSQSKNVCSSGRVPVAVHVGSSVAPAVNPFNFCGSAKVSDLIIPSATGISYKWFSSSTSTTELASSTVLVSGTYYVSRIENGCESSKAPVLVTIHTIPNAPTGNASQSFGVGATINSIVLNQQGVVWYSTYYDSQNGINPLSPGMPLVNGTTYYGVQIGTNNCASLPFVVTVDVVLSDKEFEKSELKYHPNPVDDVLNITYSEKITQIEVFDLLGKRVKVQNTDDRNVIIDLSELASGTYMLQLRTETKSQFIKVIKK